MTLSMNLHVAQKVAKCYFVPLPGLSYIRWPQNCIYHFKIYFLVFELIEFWTSSDSKLTSIYLKSFCKNKKLANLHIRN